LYGQTFLALVVAAPAAWPVEAQFQSAGGSAIPQTFPGLYSDTPIRKYFPSLPRGRQFATRPEALAPPGRSPSSTGVSSGKACDARNPQPCGLTTRAMHDAAKGCLRSMLVTVMGICTRSRVLRRVAMGVDISIYRMPRTSSVPACSLTEPSPDAAPIKNE